MQQHIGASLMPQCIGAGPVYYIPGLRPLIPPHLGIGHLHGWSTTPFPHIHLSLLVDAIKLLHLTQCPDLAEEAFDRTSLTGHLGS